MDGSPAQVAYREPRNTIPAPRTAVANNVIDDTTGEIAGATSDVHDIINNLREFLNETIGHEPPQPSNGRGGAGPEPTNRAENLRQRVSNLRYAISELREQVARVRQI